MREVRREGAIDIDEGNSIFECVCTLVCWCMCMLVNRDQRPVISLFSICCDVMSWNSCCGRRIHSHISNHVLYLIMISVLPDICRCCKLVCGNVEYSN